MSVAEEDIFGLEIVVSDEYEKCLPFVEPERREEYVIYKIRPVTNAPEGAVEIHACLLPQAEEQTDYGRKDCTSDNQLEVISSGNDGYVIVDAEEKGFLYVEARLKGSTETKNWAEIRIR